MHFDLTDLVEKTRLAVHKQSFLNLLRQKWPPRDKRRFKLLTGALTYPRFNEKRPFEGFVKT